jgi:aminopeptidase-like protein
LVAEIMLISTLLHLSICYANLDGQVLVTALALGYSCRRFGGTYSFCFRRHPRVLANKIVTLRNVTRTATMIA